MVQLRSEPVASVGGRSDRIRPLTKDDLPSLKISRLRATGVVTPDMTSVTVAIGELERRVGLSHTRFPNNGGWSWFVCPQCQHRTSTLRLTEDNRLACWKCDGAPYACQRRGNAATRIAHLRALLYGSPARHKPRCVNIDRRRSLEAALRRLLIRQRQERLDRIESARKAMKS